MFVTFPCVSGTKRPAIKQWQHLTASIPHVPGTPYGILCGAINDLIVIDCDRLKDPVPASTTNLTDTASSGRGDMCGVAAFHQILARNSDDTPSSSLAALDTLVVRTQNRGLHVYFRYIDGIVDGVAPFTARQLGLDNDNANAKVHLDILSNKRYVMGYDSPGYTVLHGSPTRIARMPDWMVRLFAASVSNSSTAAAAATATAVKRKSKAGQGRLPRKLQRPSPALLGRVRHIVASLSPQLACNRDTWIRVVWAIANAVGDEYRDEGLHLADDFSKLAPTKYKGVDDVRAIYESADRRYAAKALPTLLQYATTKTSSTPLPLTADLNLSMNKSCFGDDGDGDGDGDENSATIISVVGDSQLQVVNATTAVDVDVDLARVTDRRDNASHPLLFTDEVPIPSQKLQFIREFDIRDNVDAKLRLRADGFSIVNGVDSRYLQNDSPWLGRRDTNMKTMIYTRPRPHNTRRMANKRENQLLAETIAAHIRKHAEKRWNVNFFLCENYIENQVVNHHRCSGGENDEKVVRGESDFIALLADDETCLRRFVYCPAEARSNFGGVYYCDPDTNVWRPVHAKFIEQFLLKQLQESGGGGGGGSGNEDELNERELRYIKQDRSIRAIRHWLERNVMREDFVERARANSVRTFVLDNGLLAIDDDGSGSGSGCMRWRETRVDDYAIASAGWSYDEEEARRYRADVDAFLATLWPIAAEREVVLRFVASLLHGNRLDKKFLVLTDKRQGNNGKSTFLNLLRVFFGDYLKSSTKFVCRAAQQYETKNSHDAGLEPMVGKRVLLCDELKKSHHLDEGLLKNLAGGPYVVEGRRCGLGEYFKFTWQAGIVLVFNEGDCPQFDAADSALLERMLIAPMRSKFIVANNNTHDNDSITINTQPYTFKLNADFGKVGFFNAWRSAFLDVLRERCSLYGVADVALPSSMTEWKVDIAGDNNEMGVWALQHLTTTDDRTLFATIAELYALYRCRGVREYAVYEKQFLYNVKAMFAIKRIEIRSQLNFRINGKQFHKRNCIYGYKLIE